MERKRKKRANLITRGGKGRDSSCLLVEKRENALKLERDKKTRR